MPVFDPNGNSSGSDAEITSSIDTVTNPSKEITPSRDYLFREQIDQNRNADKADLNSLGSDPSVSGASPYGMPINRNYLARIVQDGKTIARGYLPETFQVSVNAHFNAPFGQGVAQDSAAATALKVMGHTTLMSQSMTMQVWTGSDPIELQLEMEFLAESDPKTEVIAPIKRLMRLVMPSKTNGAARLNPPGPQINWADTFAGAGSDILRGVQTGSADVAGATLRNAINAAKGKISVFVGNFLTFDNVVITNVTQVYHSMFDENGDPLRATVTIAFSTFVVPATSTENEAEDDLIRMFNGPGEDDYYTTNEQSGT